MRSLYGNTDVVAPISAPMLQIVPIPSEGSNADRFRQAEENERTRARDRLHTGSEVFNNGASTALDCQDTGEFKDDILRRGPSAQLTRQSNTDDLRAFQFPRHVRHNIDSVSTAHADAKSTEASTVRRVTVGTDQQ